MFKKNYQHYMAETKHCPINQLKELSKFFLLGWKTRTGEGMGHKHWGRVPPLLRQSGGRVLCLC